MAMKSGKAVLFLGVGLLLAAGVAAALFLTNRRDVTTSSQEAYEVYREAVANEERYYFKEAQLGFAKALELDPDFAMAMLGLSRLTEGERGLSLVKRAERLRDRLTEREKLHIDMQRAYREKDPEAALAIAHRIRNRFPDDTRATQMICVEENEKGNVEQAIQIFRDHLETNPNAAQAYNMIGYFEAYRSNYDAAIEALKKYQFMAPDQANPHDSLGEIQAYSGRYDEAIASLNKALAVKPDFFAAYDHLGVAYEGKGDFARAIEHYRKAAELSPGDGAMGRGYLYKALRVAFRTGNREAVESLYTRLEALPRDEHSQLRAAINGAARDLFEGRPEPAERALEEARPRLLAVFAKRSKLPGYKAYDGGLNDLLARAKLALGKKDEAMKLYEEMANPPNKWSNFEERRWVYEGRAGLAVLLAERGELDRAEKLLAANRLWNPSWAPTRPEELTVARARRDKVLAAAR